MKQETQGGMRIKSGTFYRSYGGGEYFNTQGLGEIAVAGRSNAGKSSMINFLLKNGKAARVSAQPGKTRLVNYFLVRTETDGVRGEFFLADLPGYGYARISGSEKERFGSMLETYFGVAEHLCGLLVLMDIRHIPTEEDRQMIELAEFCGVPYVVLASKADKIAKSKRQSEAEKLRKHLRTSFSYPIIPVSSKEGIGEARVLEAIREFLSRPAQPPVEEGEEV